MLLIIVKRLNKQKKLILFNIIKFIYNLNKEIIIWGLGIGPNPQSPIPNPQSPIPNFLFFNKKIKFKKNKII